MELKFLKIIALLMIFTLHGCGHSGSGDGHSEEEEAHGHGHDHDSEEGGDEVELTKAQMDAVGIRLGGFEARNLSEVISASGRVEIPAGSERIVAPLYAGKVSRLLVSVGQRVKPGDIVAWMDAPEIVTIRQQIREAAQEVETARQELVRQEALAAQGAGVRKNLDNARSAVKMAELKVEGFKKQLAVYGLSADGIGGDSFPVKSDVSGIVTSIDVPVGGFADIQTPIVRVTDTDALFVTLQLPEKDINSVRTGMSVDMQLTNDPSSTFIGKIEQFMPMMDQETRMLPVRVSIAGDRSGMKLIPGMAVSARISAAGGAATALPEGAVVSVGGKSYVFVLEEQHGDDFHFKKVEVAVGPTELGYTAVTPLSDLPSDARIVVSGAFYLNSMVADHGEHHH